MIDVLGTPDLVDEDCNLVGQTFVGKHLVNLAMFLSAQVGVNHRLKIQLPT